MDEFPLKIADASGVVVAEAAGEFDGLAILTFLPAGEYRVGDARARVSRVFDWDGDLVLVDCGQDLRPWHCITARHPESSLIDPRIRGRLMGTPDPRPAAPAAPAAAAPAAPAAVRPDWPRRRRAPGTLANSVPSSGEVGAAS